MTTRACAAALLTALAFAAPLGAGGAPAADSERELALARAEAASAARAYRASLDRLVQYREDAVQWATVTLDNRRRLLAIGGVSRVEVERAERELATAEAALAANRADIAEADRLVAEAVAALTLPPLAPGTIASTATVVQHRGRAVWSLARVDIVRRFFAERFGRPLPVSALGQTPVHDRLGFDHRNAVDIAVHPDSVEGQALIAWLRRQGVSFLAFRGAVPGEATGAHVHIGEPSPRRAG
jgi:hypothetical protein